jgi:hypothetical protein
LDFPTYLRLGEGNAELMEADAARHLDGLIVGIKSGKYGARCSRILLCGETAIKWRKTVIK